MHTEHTHKIAPDFKLTGEYTKKFLITGIVGIVLLILGFVLSLTGGSKAHEETHTDSHAVKQSVYTLASSHEEGGNNGHATAEDKEHEVTKGERHSEHAPGSTLDNNTVLRAPLHPGQTEHIYHVESNATMARLGSAWLIGNFFWIAVALFGIFFIAIGYAANAGWYVPFKRIPEAFYRFIPIAGIALVLFFIIFGKAVYAHWLPGEVAAHDELVANKKPFLTGVFYLITVVFFSLIWTYFGHRIRKYSLAEDKVGGLDNHRKSTRISIMFLPIFALTFCVAAFLWIMSIEAHWFSTIFGVYCFAGLFVSGIIVTLLIVTHLMEKGFLPNVSHEQLHDLGKLMFAFSVFWAYIWISQYLLIWYANIPEETPYYALRFEGYSWLFFLNLAINFIFPFLVLMTRDAKRQIITIRRVCYVLLFGRFLDLYLMIVPGSTGGENNLGLILMGIGMIVLMGAGFMFVVFKGLSQAKMEARNHPYFEEGVHHETGV